jgi:hypothetical protein
MYICLPGASASVFAVFPCDSLDDGTTWLKSDYAVSCSNKTHDQYLVFAGVMVLIYPIGIPLSYALLLYRRSHKLNPKEDRSQAAKIKQGRAGRTFEESTLLGREMDQDLQSTVFLWGSYRPVAWWL